MVMICQLQEHSFCKQFGCAMIKKSLTTKEFIQFDIVAIDQFSFLLSVWLTGNDTKNKKGDLILLLSECRY